MKKTAEGELLNDDVSNYDKDAYEKPSVTVDICICTIKGNDLKVLLIKRKYPPFRDCWAIPGGFVELDKNETLEETAKRELFEETGLKGIFIEQLKTYGDPDRDPRMRIITVANFALVPYDKISEIKAGDDAKETEWFSLRNLPELSFDHKRILKDLLNRLIGKLYFSPIAFSLVPLQFTWRELQDVYEIILQRKLLAPNFRRDVSRDFSIIDTGKIKAGSSGRHPKLLKYEKQKTKF